MKTIIQMSEAEETQALPLLLRHSPGTVLPNRIYVVSEEAAKRRSPHLPLRLPAAV
jgi:hypothetical protein